MKYVIYCRMSLPKRDKHTGEIIVDPATLEMQRDECVKYINGAAPYVVFAETGHSHLPLDRRPVLYEAIQALDVGDILVTWRDDRLGRNTEEKTLIRRMIRFKKQADYRSATESYIGMDDPDSRMFSQIIGAVGEYEHAMIRMRTKAGLAQRVARGERLGKCRYGMRPVGERGQEADPGEQYILKKMLKYDACHMSLRDIARQLNHQGHMTRCGTPWTFDRVAKILKRHRPTADSRDPAESRYAELESTPLQLLE